MRDMHISKRTEEGLSLPTACFLSLLSDALHGTQRQSTAEQVKALDEQGLSQTLLLSNMHNVPMVGERLYRLGIGGQWRGKLREDLIRVTAYEASATQLLLSLLEALYTADIPALVIKGAVCRSLYPIPELRPSSDEDIYVAEEQTAAAEEILIRQGYSRGDEGAGGTVHAWSKGVLRVELHSSLFDDLSIPGGGDLLENHFQRTTFVVVEGKSIMTLHPQEHFIYLILHYYKHFLSGGVGIRQICDICLFARHYEDQINWAEVWSVLQSLRLHILVWNIRDIGIQYLGQDSAIMPGAKEMSQADSMALLLDTLGAGVFGASSLARKHSGTMTIQAVRGGGGKMGGIGAALFPSVKSLSGRYPYLQKYPWLLPAAWCSRGIKYLREGRNLGSRAALATQIGRQRLELLEQYGIVDR